MHSGRSAAGSVGEPAAASLLRTGCPPTLHVTCMTFACESRGRGSSPFEIEAGCPELSCRPRPLDLRLFAYLLVTPFKLISSTRCNGGLPRLDGRKLFARIARYVLPIAL